MRTLSTLPYIFHSSRFLPSASTLLPYSSISFHFSSACTPCAPAFIPTVLHIPCMCPLTFLLIWLSPLHAFFACPFLSSHHVFLIWILGPYLYTCILFRYTPYLPTSVCITLHTHLLLSHAPFSHVHQVWTLPCWSLCHVAVYQFDFATCNLSKHVSCAPNIHIK